MAEAEDVARDPSTIRAAAPDAPQLKIQQMLDLLACPACLGSLHLASTGVACTACERVYPVLDGIPILLVDRATMRA